MIGVKNVDVSKGLVSRGSGKGLRVSRWGLWLRDLASRGYGLGLGVRGFGYWVRRRVNLAFRVDGLQI